MGFVGGQRALVRVPAPRVESPIAFGDSGDIMVAMSDAVATADETARVPNVLIRDLPPDLHRRLRVAAAFRGVSLSAFGQHAVAREVERVEAEMERDRRKREQREKG
jgi:hypothetical protein